MPPLPCVCKTKQTNLNNWCGLSFSLCWLWSSEYVNGYMRHLKYMLTCEYIWCGNIYICICNFTCRSFHFTCCDVISMHDFCFTLCFTCQRWVGRDLLISNAMMNFWSRPTHPSFPTPKRGKSNSHADWKTWKDNAMRATPNVICNDPCNAMQHHHWDRTPLWPQPQKIGAEPRSFPAVDMAVWCFWKVSQINYLTWPHMMFLWYPMNILYDTKQLMYASRRFVLCGFA